MIIRNSFSEILAGKGPDIVYFNSFTIGSIYKILENGVFHDLQPLIDDDLSFDTSKYNTTVLIVEYTNKSTYSGFLLIPVFDLI